MNTLNDSAKWIIRNFNAASVASIDDDGFPAVSPKATFVIVNDTSIAFGNIRSPATIHNFSHRPKTEINFIDVLHRRALRIKGRVFLIDRESHQWKELAPLFQELWKPYLEMMTHFVLIDIERASLVTSPAYDIGIAAAELRTTNLEKLNNLVPSPPGSS